MGDKTPGFFVLFLLSLLSVFPTAKLKLKPESMGTIDEFIYANLLGTELCGEDEGKQQDISST